MRSYIFFLCIFFETLLGKPTVDFQDSYVWGYYVDYCERPEFIARFKEKNSHVIVLTEENIRKVKEMRRKGYKKVVAFLLEPNIFPGGLYEYVEKHISNFDLVLTFDKSLLLRYPNKCKFVPAVVPSYIEDQRVHPKTKLCSIIFGAADITEGHRLRKKVFLKYKSYFDGYKTDATPRSVWKDEWTNSFCFSVVIENSRNDHYFSEKIIDCFRAGTIPIYWGSSSIGDFFDKDGIISFNSLEDLEPILANLSFEEYEKRKEAVERNFHIAENYPPIRSRDSSVLPCVIDSVWPHIKIFFENGE